MRNALVVFLMLMCMIDARAQRSVTATIQNFNRTGTDFSFDLYARSTGAPQISLGWSSFYFYFNSSALASPMLTNINTKFSGDSLTADYAPMRVSIVNSIPPRLGIQIYYSGRGTGTGQPLSTAAPNGELICTVRLAITDGSANSDMSWDAGSSNANTWILSKDTVQVANTIDGVGSSTNDVTVGNGWNIVSVPVVAVNMQSATLFPGASTPAYGYNNGYFTADPLTTAKGYWIKFGAVDTITVFGTKVSPSTIPVVAGWNIVGPLEFNARTAAITSTPSGIIATPFYGYTNGYIVADTVKRGQGYWVKTTQAGTLNLSSAAAKIGASNAIVVDNWIHIEIEDNASNKGILYLAKAEELHGSFELPPPGPSGIFDVRYASNTIAEPLGGTAHQVQLNSVTYPVKIKATNLDGMTLRVKDIINGSLGWHKRETASYGV